MVKIILVVVLCVMDVFGDFQMNFPLRFTTVVPASPIGQHFGKYLAKRLDFGYNKYESIANTQDLNTIEQPNPYSKSEKYLLVKIPRHRNKRYLDPLTLCPYKLCSMLRKRRNIGDNIKRKL